jgi:hypothetical protein
LAVRRLVSTAGASVELLLVCGNGRWCRADRDFEVVSIHKGEGELPREGPMDGSILCHVDANAGSSPIEAMVVEVEKAN